MSDNQIVLRRFGDYNFGSIIASVEDDMPAASISVVDFNGSSGGLEVFGDDDNPKGPKTMNVSCILTAETSSSLQNSLDAFIAAMRKGRKFLWMAPGETGNTDKWRFTLAKVGDLSRKADVKKRLVMPMSVRFSIASPYWYNGGSQTATFMDDGGLLDTPGRILGGGTAQNIVDGTTLSYTNEGNATTYPTLIFDANSQTMSNLTVSRLDSNSNVVESFNWSGSLTGTESLYIYCADYQVTYTGVSGYGFAQLTPGAGQRGFLSLPPGTWTYKVNGTFSGTGKLTVEYLHCWH